LFDGDTLRCASLQTRRASHRKSPDTTEPAPGSNAGSRRERRSVAVGHPQSPEETDLFGPYRKGLNAFFRREWRFSVEDAQDLTQEASLRAFQCLHQLESPE